MSLCQFKHDVFGWAGNVSNGPTFRPLINTYIDVSAFYYYSLPRLRANGQLHVRTQRLAVRGLAWLDRARSTSAPGARQTGWDWFSPQLQDARNLMYYQVRRTDGSADHHSSGLVSDARGLRRRLDPAGVGLTPLAWWRAGDRRYLVE
jgi:predicted secreted hydrolase